MHYNLDAIIAVGYRVNSIQATHFRQWATKVLKEYIIKGFALDDDRLKQAKTVLGKDYFQELLERHKDVACELIRGRVGNRFVSRQLAWNTGRTFMFPPGFVFGLS